MLSLYQRVQKVESLQKLIDKEIREIISTQYDKALEIVRNNEDNLEKAVVVLLEKEKIDGKELKQIMGIPEDIAPKQERAEDE